MPTTHVTAGTCSRTALVLSLCFSSSRGLQQPSVRLAIARSRTAEFPARRSAKSTRAYAALVDGPSTHIDRTDTDGDASTAAAAPVPQSNQNLIGSANTIGPVDEAVEVTPVLLRNELLLQRDDLATQRRAATELQDTVRDNQDKLFLLLASVPPLLAFIAWIPISQAVSIFFDMFGPVGRAVDGNQFRTELLRPTIVGVVVPVISIALATLTSSTVNVLRARQVELRALVNKEACELRLLRRAVFGMFGTRQHAGRRSRALGLLWDYAAQLTSESNVGAVEALEELQLSGGGIAVNELDSLSAMLHGVDGAAASRQGSVSAADDLILSLNGHRSNRVALLLSVFPDVHWFILAALSLSVCATFLMVSNQQVLQYLSSVQLRALFAILVGVGSGTATLCLDLADPFRGSFSIVEAASQLGDLRVCLEEDMAEAKAEAREISPTILQALFGDGVGVNRYNSGLRPSQRLGDRSSKRLGGVSSTSINSGDCGEIGEDAAATNPADSPRSGNVSGRGGGDDGQWGSSQSGYGLRSTLYFHLLTGPLGSNVRVLGDVIVWVVTIVAAQIRALSRRLVALSAAVAGKGRWPWRRSKPE